MDFLKAEMERKRRQIEQSNVMAPNKKYFRRGDLAKKQEEEYWKVHAPKIEEKKVEQVEPSVSNVSTEESEAKALKHILPRKEVIRRLRERMEPITLFAETEYEAFQRLKKLEILEPEVNKGFKNDLKAAMDQVDQEYLQEIMRSSEGQGQDDGSVKVKDDGITEDDLNVWKQELGIGDSGRDQEITLTFMKYVLQLWGKDINTQNKMDKRTTRGKLMSATHSQTVQYMKPLFRKLKSKSCPPDILEYLVEILKHLLERHYIKANDAYLEMAIGNAPWPIGVTMVGIHARTGREKIFAKNVAHVLNDETQRKYIQGLKRIMTQCQKFFPTDPSRSVNYESVKDK